MIPSNETPAQRARRIADDLHTLRIRAWCVQRNRYNRESVRWTGGRRGTARIGTVVFFVEPPDYYEADRAVRDVEARWGAE